MIRLDMRELMLACRREKRRTLHCHTRSPSPDTPGKASHLTDVYHRNDITSRQAGASNASQTLSKKQQQCNCSCTCSVPTHVLLSSSTGSQGRFKAPIQRTQGHEPNPPPNQFPEPPCYSRIEKEYRHWSREQQQWHALFRSHKQFEVAIAYTNSVHDTSQSPLSTRLRLAGVLVSTTPIDVRKLMDIPCATSTPTYLVFPQYLTNPAHILIEFRALLQELGARTNALIRTGRPFPIAVFLAKYDRQDFRRLCRPPALEVKPELGLDLCWMGQIRGRGQGKVTLVWHRDLMINT